MIFLWFLNHFWKHPGFSVGFAQFLGFGLETSWFHPDILLILGGFGLICPASLRNALQASRQAWNPQGNAYPTGTDMETYQEIER